MSILREGGFRVHINPVRSPLRQPPPARDRAWDGSSARDLRLPPMKSEPARSEVAVTVVTIFLRETYLDEAIRSVLSQTFAAWELMLVDDGSTDRSSDIAQQYAVRYPEKIRLVEHAGHQNRGISASRNLGICAARGKYIACSLRRRLAPGEAGATGRDPRPASRPQSSTMSPWWFSWTGKPKDAVKDEPRPLGVAPGRLVYPPK